IIERLGTSRTAVEHARLLVLTQEMQIHRHDIINKDEVTLLTTIHITIPATKQKHMTVATVLQHIVISHRGHTTFVLLLWTIDIEVTQADHWCTQTIQMTTQHLVELKLGIAVDVQRRFVAEVLSIQGT